MIAVLGPRYKDRQGGYVRVLKAGFRYGDCAPMAIIELVDKDVTAKGKGSKIVEVEADTEESKVKKAAAKPAKEKAEKTPAKKTAKKAEKTAE